MISYLKRQGLYEISIGVGEEFYEEPSVQLNDYDRAFGVRCLVISLTMRYLIDSTTYPKDLWTTLDRVLGKHNEDSSSYLESASRSSIISLSKYVLASTFFDEVEHDE